jgi:hypothetical protein
MKGLAELGKLTIAEIELIRSQHLEMTSLTSGRWLWVGGTEWVSKPENYQGAYNCSNIVVDSFGSMAHCMDLLMQGCGVGTIIETDVIDKLPVIESIVNLEIFGSPGNVESMGLASIEKTIFNRDGAIASIVVGDSRQGWVDAYLAVLNLAATYYSCQLHLTIDLSHVRAAGAPIKGFGGVSNPSGLKHMFERMVEILNGAVGRKLNSLEVCLLLDEPALAVVAGNVRRSANIRQFSSDDKLALTAKDGLWVVDDDGKWHIDPKRDALRMSNHTRVFHQKPTLDECIEAVRKQYHSGEGAIQWAGESVMRANVDLLDTPSKKSIFLQEYEVSRIDARNYLEFLLDNSSIESTNVQKELDHRMMRYGTNPCLAAGTMILTRNGHYPIESLIGKTVDIWDGLNWVEIDSFCETGTNKDIYELHLSDGSAITATPNHEFVMALGDKKELRDLTRGDKLKIHNVQPDGMHANRSTHPIFVVDIADAGIADKVYCCNVPTTHQFALSCGIMSGNCGEIILNNNFCNLSEVHLNLLDPLDTLAQSRAFKAAAISACALLHHQFIDEKMQYSREIDPIVGVSFTGLFDFFVNLFGVDWLKWWEAGRPDKWGAGDNDYLPLSCIDEADYFRITERHYLTNWRLTVESTVAEYCERHNLKRPNRCTTVQPAGTKSLLTGASPGWHPPKAQRFIRRITFRREDPVALAALDYGYSVIPSQSDKDEHGNLLDDPFDPRCTEWLVEVPIEVPWANLPVADAIDINRFSALAQFDFYMQIQQWYTTHNTSATIEFREHEIEALGEAIYRAILADEGYISAALLARFDASDGTFPRLPFEPIDKDTYNRLIDEMMARRIAPSFEDALANRDVTALAVGSDNLTGPIACDSDKCLMPDKSK